MNTFETIFPTFLTKCGELHTLLQSVAFALFITGVITTVWHKPSEKTIMRLLIRLVQLLIIKRDPSTASSWWNVMAQLHELSTDLIITAFLWLVGHFAAVLMFWAYIFQTVILNLGYALSPLIIGFMAIPALRDIGRNYLLNLGGVLLWPLGWAVAALVTQGMLDFLSNPAFDFMDLTSPQPDMQKTLGAATIGFWIIFSTIAAPIIIQKMLITGALATTGLFSGAATTAGQTLASTVRGGIAAAPLGPVGVVAGAGTAGVLTMASTSTGIGDAGSFVNGLFALSSSKNDPSGDKAVQQRMAKASRHSCELPPILPAS